MKKQITIFILWFIFPNLLFGETSQMKDLNKAQGQINNLIKKLESYEIETIEILQIPPEILTRTHITPETIGKQFHYKLTIRDIRGGHYRKNILEKIKSSGVKTIFGMPDIRWGIIFYGIDKNRAGSIYFSKTGQSGAINDIPVLLKGPFFEWLNSNFSSCFR